LEQSKPKFPTISLHGSCSSTSSHEYYDNKIQNCDSKLIFRIISLFNLCLIEDCAAVFHPDREQWAHRINFLQRLVFHADFLNKTAKNSNFVNAIIFFDYNLKLWCKVFDFVDCPHDQTNFYISFPERLKKLVESERTKFMMAQVT